MQSKSKFPCLPSVDSLVSYVFCLFFLSWGGGKNLKLGCFGYNFLIGKHFIYMDLVKDLWNWWFWSPQTQMGLTNNGFISLHLSLFRFIAQTAIGLFWLHAVQRILRASAASTRYRAGRYMTWPIPRWNNDLLPQLIAWLSILMPCQPHRPC